MNCINKDILLPYVVTNQHSNIIINQNRNVYFSFLEGGQIFQNNKFIILTFYFVFRAKKRNKFLFVEQLLSKAHSEPNECKARINTNEFK